MEKSEVSIMIFGVSTEISLFKFERGMNYTPISPAFNGSFQTNHPLAALAAAVQHVRRHPRQLVVRASRTNSGNLGISNMFG
jgi:hypothetical protein